MTWFRCMGKSTPSAPTELYSFNQSQGGVWINTQVNVTDLNALLFVFDSGTSDFKMRQLLKSDIAVYTGGTDIYTTIFPSGYINLAMNVRIYNDVLWVSFNGVGPASNVVTVYEPITL